MFARLFPRVGFPWTMRAIGFLYLGLLVIANVTVESRLKPHPSPLILREFIAPLAEPAFLLTTLACFFFFWGVFLPLNFIILEAEYFGMSPGLAAYMVAVLNGARYIPYAIMHIIKVNAQAL